MRNLLHTLLLLLAALPASAQFLPENLSGGGGAPGPTRRSPLNSMSRTSGSGATILTDTYGNQHFASYVNANLTAIAYVPTATGNTSNLSQFVIDPTGRKWYIDWQGDAMSLEAPPSCDQDLLTLRYGCPTSINDTLFKYKSLNIGGRYIWPTSEIMATDSVAVGLVGISGNRNARLMLYDNLNQTYSVLDQGGGTTSLFMQPGATFSVQTAATGTPQQPAGPFVDHFGINTGDNTVQLYKYPSTRVDVEPMANVLYSDTEGKVRSNSLSALRDSINNIVRITSASQFATYPANPNQTVIFFDDPYRGGTFLVQSSGTADNAITFAGAGGKYWKRQVTQGRIFASWFGATPGDATDDRAAIQSALDYADANNYPTVYFPGGEYRLTDTLRVPDVSLIGDNGRQEATEFQWTNAVPANRNLLYFYENYTSEIRDLELDAFSVLDTTTVICFRYGAANSTIANVTLSGGNNGGGEVKTLGIAYWGTKPDGTPVSGNSSVNNLLLACNLRNQLSVCVKYLRSASAGSNANRIIGSRLNATKLLLLVQGQGNSFQSSTFAAVPSQWYVLIDGSGDNNYFGGNYFDGVSGASAIRIDDATVNAFGLRTHAIFVGNVGIEDAVITDVQSPTNKRAYVFGAVSSTFDALLLRNLQLYGKDGYQQFKNVTAPSGPASGAGVQVYANGDALYAKTPTNTFLLSTDINSLTAEPLTSSSDDYAAFYDNSATANRKARLRDINLPDRSSAIMSDEFFQTSTWSGLALSQSGTGAGIGSNVTGESNHPGIVNITTGTTTTGRAGLISGITAVRLSGGKVEMRFIFRLPTLSNGTDTYTFRGGLIDAANAEPTDGVYIRYTHSVNSGAFEFVTRDNGTETATTTTVTAAANTWYNCVITVDAGANNAVCTLAGTTTTNTTNIPSGANRVTGISPGNIIKSAGTTAATVDVDYYSYSQDFTTAR